MFSTLFLAIYTLSLLPSSASPLARATTPILAGLNLEKPATNLTLPRLFSPATNLSYIYKKHEPLEKHNAYLRMTLFQDSPIPALAIQDVLDTIWQELKADVVAKGDETLLPKPLKKHSVKYGAHGCWFTTQPPSRPPSRFTYGILLEAVERIADLLSNFSYIMYAEVHKGRDGLGGWIGSIILEDHAISTGLSVS